MTDYVFPEDRGTNSNITAVDGGDDGDAANFADAAYVPNNANFVVSGLNITDNGDGTIDVSSGEAKISDGSADAAQSGETRKNVLYTVEADARSGVAVASSTVNEVYIDVQLTDNDALSIDVRDDGTSPPEPVLKIGEVDASNNTVTEVNRSPEGEYSDIQVNDHNNGTWLATWMANIDSDKLDSANYTPEQDTHNRYSDSEARSAVDGANIDITGDADTVDGYHGNDLARPKNSASFSSTDTSTNINQNSWTVIPWNLQLDVDAGYSHDPANNPGQITFDSGGTYKIHAMLSYDSNRNERINPGIKFSVNGTRRDRLGLSGYVRNKQDHDQASNYLTEQITVNSGDTLRVETYQYANGGTVTLRDSESLLLIEQVSKTVSIADDADTVDGKHAADFVLAGGDTMTGPLTLNQIDGANGNHRIRFDNNSFVEITDHSNSRNDLVTQDTYINETKTWLAEHIRNNSAHHSRYSDGEARSAIDGNSISPSSVDTDDATVNTSLTDAAGVKHTGKLADASDVKSTTNGNGNYEINVDGDVYEFVSE
jgi:hypothetical protein